MINIINVQNNAKCGYYDVSILYLQKYQYICYEYNLVLLNLEIMF